MQQQQQQQQQQSQFEQHNLERVISLFIEIAESQHKLLSSELPNETFIKDEVSSFQCNSSTQVYEMCEVEREEQPFQQSKDFVFTHCSSSYIEASGGGEDQVQKQNVIKNILKSFLKFITTISDTLIQQQYLILYSPTTKVSYTEIKKSLSKRIKEKKTRWNLKLKSIIQSKKFSLIFYDYLQSKSNEWLSNSRVFDIDSHRKVIDQLISQIKNGEPCKMKTYKKK